MPGLFDKLPFKQAIDALRERLAIPKTEFLKWDAANRSRAFTMARVADLDVLQNIHDEISIAIDSGETYADFEKRMADVQARSGWTGSEPWHYRLVYDTNLGMAYSSGRVEQGRSSGLTAWRYLPSLSDDPRAEHQAYYNQLYRMEPGSPVPPLDFGCNCGWEWVFPHELEGVKAEDLPVFNPPTPASGFTWSPAAYSDVGTMPSLNKGSGFGVQGSVKRVNRQDAKTPSGDMDRWVPAIMDLASEIGAKKFGGLRTWMDELAKGGASLAEIRDRLSEAAARIAVADEIELNAQALMMAWMKGAASVETASKTNRNKAANAAGMARMICEPIAVDGLDGRVLLILWGKNKRRDGMTQIVDADSAGEIVREFNGRMIDMVIDFEHQSEGGEFAAPDGLAPAAGWVRKGSLTAIPNKGIYGDVSWTKRAAAMISNREYRYLSPVTFVDSKTGKVFVLDKVALTNTPAIEGFPPLVNKAGAYAPESEKGMDALIAYLRQVLGLDASATPEDILAKMKGGEAAAVANKATAEALLQIAKEEFGDDGQAVADAAGKGDKAGVVAVLTKTVNRLKNPPGKVDAADYKALKDRQDKLEAEIADRDCQALIVANSNKLAPANEEWFKSTYRKDPEFARKWLTEAPVLVVNKSTTGGAAASGGPSDRVTLINSARSKFREEKDTKKVLCSERAWVNNALREAGQSAMSDEETKTLAISAA